MADIDKLRQTEGLEYTQPVPKEDQMAAFLNRITRESTRTPISGGRGATPYNKAGPTTGDNDPDVYNMQDLARNGDVRDLFNTSDPAILDALMGVESYPQDRIESSHAIEAIRDMINQMQGVTGIKSHPLPPRRYK